MKYIIEQYPKYYNFNKNELSKYQIDIREKQSFIINKKNKKCKSCCKILPITEYYFADRKTGRRHNKCRDCKLKERGIVEVGKIRFSMKIFDKGFRRCSVCKNIKNISLFTKSKSYYGGYSSNCYECSNKKHSEYLKLQKENIGDFYIKQYARNRGLYNLDKNTIDKLREEIINKRYPKYFIDNKSFVTVTDFAIYIENNYGIKKSTTEKRIYNGAKETECIISDKEYRSLKSGTNKGKIKVTDTITNEVFIFFNTTDKGLINMFSLDTINKGLKSKLPVGGKRSNYKNPCIIERIII